MHRVKNKHIAFFALIAGKSEGSFTDDRGGRSNGSRMTDAMCEKPMHIERRN